MSGLVRPQDRVLYDIHSHASLWDGIRLARAQVTPFPHNDLARLERILEKSHATRGGDVFVCVEGVYSMDGDMAPLREILALCREHDAVLIVDDAHGTGVLGKHGRGTAEQLDIEGQVPITVGTFSKALAVTGGFVATSRSFAEYLRFNARSHVFSASLPPPTVAAVLAGLDVIQDEPWRLDELRQNVAYLTAGLRRLGFSLRPDAAIVPIPVPRGMDIRRAGRRFEELGIFLNAIEYPAVPASQQRFRVSVMSIHKRRDLDRLLSAVEQVWCEFEPRPRRPSPQGALAPSGASAP
jgi:glycine C-acetyltransferase